MQSAPSSNFQPSIRQATLDNQLVRFITQPGFHRWDEITAASQLLAKSFNPLLASRDGRGKTLLLGCGHGALGAALGLRFPGELFFLSDQNYIDLQMTHETIRLNTLENVAVVDDGFRGMDFDGLFSTVLIEIPKGRKLCRRWLVKAHACLQPFGQLYIAGANQEGIHSILKDAEDLFGIIKLLAYRKGSRVARAVKKNDGALSLPGWALEPGIAPGTWHEFDASLDQLTLHFRTLPGVFSYDEIDEGTRLLLSTLEISPGDSVLDFGCGYGAIGLFASKLGAALVDMIDVDLIAVACARENIQLNGLLGVRALLGDGIEGTGNRQYDLIVSNPPFHTGKEVDYQISEKFIKQAGGALKSKGRLVIVANRFIRYDQIMQKVFPKVAILAKTGKYHVISGSN